VVKRKSAAIVFLAQEVEPFHFWRELSRLLSDTSVGGISSRQIEESISICRFFPAKLSRRFLLPIFPPPPSTMTDHDHDRRLMTATATSFDGREVNVDDEEPNVCLHQLCILHDTTVEPRRTKPKLSTKHKNVIFKMEWRQQRRRRRSRTSISIQ
jgi:hypothetical protein